MWSIILKLIIRRSSLCTPLQWRHNGRDSVWNHQPHDCLLNHIFRRRSKKTSKLRITGLCAGNSPGTGAFPAQMASNVKNVPFDDVIMRCEITVMWITPDLTYKSTMVSTSCEIALRWMPQNITYKKSLLVQVLTWCRHATSHNLSQCWPRSVASLGHNELNINTSLNAFCVNENANF